MHFISHNICSIINLQTSNYYTNTNTNPRMSLVTDSDYYSPGVNNDGIYVDQIPSFNGRTQGIRCPCNNNTFAARQNFAIHIKSIGHKRWLENLNSNRANYFTELDAERQLVKQQKIIIARLEKEKSDLMRMVNTLSAINNAATANENNVDLMNFD